MAYATLPNMLSQTDSSLLHLLLTFTQRPKIRLIIHPKPPALCEEGDLVHHAFIYRIIPKTQTQSHNINMTPFNNQ